MGASASIKKKVGAARRSLQDVVMGKAIQEETWIVTIPVRVQITATSGQSRESKQEMVRDAESRLTCDAWVWNSQRCHYKLKSLPPNDGDKPSSPARKDSR